MNIVRSVDIGHMRGDHADIAILNALRDTLDELDEWTLTDEGTWEEYAKSGGAFYVPHYDPYEEPEEYWEAVDATRDYIEELESRLDYIGIHCGADGESGMYWIERMTDEA